MTKPVLILLITLFSLHLFAQNTQNIRGKIIDNDSERPISGASVQLANAKIGSTANENGEFKLTNVPVGRHILKISSVGYETQEIAELLLESGKELILEIKLKESSKQLAEAVVKASSPNLSGAVTSIQSITIEQVMRYPATFLDPARLAQSFAGVTNDNDQANGMAIRGNSPNSMQWRLEGVEIVNPNHLSNAGTFGDRSTQNAGGTNMLSAQLLGNMNFLTGAFPAEYGNALSGVMDMRLRAGNNQKHEFTAQAGLIGIDLAAEGPLSSAKNASYLVNYRYSFTGLLGLMGISFGGEAIKFQDFSMNLTFPTAHAGTFTAFGIVGNSSNIFKTQRDATQWIYEKNAYDITFKSKMGVGGITHHLKVGNNATLHSVLAVSGLQNQRLGYLLNATTYNSTLVESDSISKQKISFTTGLTQKLSSSQVVKLGIFLTHNYDKMAITGTQKAVGSGSGLVIQPYVSWAVNLSEKLKANLGFHYLNYTFNKSQSLEPRASFVYTLSPKQSIGLAYGLHSQLQMPQVYFGYNLLDNSNINKNIGLTKAHHLVLNHQVWLSKSAYFKTELYYQKLFNVPITSAAQSGLSDFSTLNLIENFINNKLYNVGTGQNYGIELTYQKYLTKGFFMLTNLSLYNSTYKGSDNVERSTRFNGNHIFNLTVGKEWAKKNNKLWGANARIVWLGGLRDTPIDLAASTAAQKTVYVANQAFSSKQQDFFRPDVRLYWRKSKKTYSRMISLDIQNVAGVQNVAFSYYDFMQKQIVKKYQLGMIPMLNYRWEF